MSSSVFIPTSSTFNMAAINQTAQSNQTQMAQFAISQAAGFMANNQNSLAIESFKKALALDPQNTTAYNYLGQIYMSQGNNSAAISAYKQLVNILGTSASSYSSTVRATSITNATQNLYSAAAPTLQTAYVSLGNAYVQNKQYTQSEAAFKTAEKLNPQDPVAPYTLGQQYLTQGNLSGALAQFQKTQKISPNDGNVYYALGEVYNQMGDYQQAATNLTKSLNLMPNTPNTNYQLGLAYNGLGQTANAQKQLTILDNSNPTLASQLSSTLDDKPQMVAFDSSVTQNNPYDTALLGPGRPLWMLDPSLMPANSSAELNVTISFNNAMSASSVTNTANWSISKADSQQAGYYTNQLPETQNVILPTAPTAVVYNSNTNEATLTFQLNQNSDGNAEIDAEHVVFTFNGEDASGQTMDQTANSIDGANSAPF